MLDRYKMEGLDRVVKLDGYLHSVSTHGKLSGNVCLTCLTCLITHKTPPFPMENTKNAIQN